MGVIVGVEVNVGLGVKVDVGVYVDVGVDVSVTNIFPMSATPQEIPVNAMIPRNKTSLNKPLSFMIRLSPIKTNFNLFPLAISRKKLSHALDLHIHQACDENDVYSGTINVRLLTTCSKSGRAVSLNLSFE